MAWTLWPHVAPELPTAEPSGGGELRELGPEEARDESADGIQVLGPLPDDDGPQGCWRVRPMAPDQARPVPARRPTEVRRQLDPAQSSLAEIGLPEHLVPPGGGIFELLTLLEHTPPPRIPSLRPGDEVAVVVVGEHSAGVSDPTDRTELVSAVCRSLRGRDGEVEPEQVHLLEWPGAADAAATSASSISDAVRAMRARVELLAVHADCPGTVAYPACRALPNAQLYLTGVLGARRPAAPLSWGAPIAFVDGRPSNPAVLAAILADRLAGGVA